MLAYILILVYQLHCCIIFGYVLDFLDTALQLLEILPIILLSLMVVRILLEEEVNLVSLCVFLTQGALYQHDALLLNKETLIAEGD